MRAAAIILSTLALAACHVAGNAEEDEAGPAAHAAASRAFSVGDFTSVSLGGSHNVVVRVGPATSVRAEGAAEDLDRLEIMVKNGDLHIGTKKGAKWSIGFRRHEAPVTIYVTTPALASAAIGGSGDMTIDKVEGSRFSASIGGSGDMEVAALQVGEASFNIAGSGGIKAAGTAGSTSVAVAGSGDVDVAGLASRTASISIVGSGDVRAQATGSADISIMGSGDVTVRGTAKCSVNKMGSGEAHCGA